MSTFPLNNKTSSSLELRRPCACCRSLCEFICVSVLLYLEDTASLVSSTLSLTIFLPSLTLRWGIWWRGEGFGEDTHLGLSVPRSLTLCVLPNGGSLYQFPSTLEGNIFGDDWTSHWSISRADYSFQSTMLCGFSPGHWPVYSKTPANLSSVSHEFPFIEWALNTIRQWLVTSEIFVLLLQQCTMQAGHHCSQGL